LPRAGGRGGKVTDYFSLANPRTCMNTRPISVFFGRRPMSQKVPPGEGRGGGVGGFGGGLSGASKRGGRGGAGGEKGVRGGARGRGVVRGGRGGGGMWSASRITETLAYHHSVPGAPTFTGNTFSKKKNLCSKLYTKYTRELTFQNVCLGLKRFNRYSGYDTFNCRHQLVAQYSLTHFFFSYTNTQKKIHSG
jgi:hypothetical protein